MHYNIVFPLRRLSEHSFRHFAFTFTSTTPAGKTFFSQYVILYHSLWIFCFFFKLFTNCFVFLYFLARGGLGIPDSIRHYLNNPSPVPRRPRQLPQPSQRRQHSNPSRVYCQISEFIWLYQEEHSIRKRLDRTPSRPLSERLAIFVFWPKLHWQSKSNFAARRYESGTCSRDPVAIPCKSWYR